MTNQESTALFDLVFEGPSNDSLQTIQKIKGVFLAHLELPIPEIQKILESAPVIIKSSDQENDLKQAYHLLKNAGAKVLLVRKAEPTSSHGPNAVTETEDGFTFEMPLEPSEPQESKPPKVYSLDLDDESAGEALESIIHETAPTEAVPAEPDNVPTLTLNPEAETEVPVEPPPAAPAPAAPLVEENSLLLALDETMSKVEQALESTAEAAPPQTIAPAASDPSNSLALSFDETMSKVDQALATANESHITESKPALTPALDQTNSLSLSFDEPAEQKAPEVTQQTNSANALPKTEDSVSLEIRFDDDRDKSPPVLPTEEPDSIPPPEDSRVKEVVAAPEPTPPEPPPPAPPPKQKTEIETKEATAEPASMDIVPNPAPTLRESFSTSKSKEAKLETLQVEVSEEAPPPKKRLGFLKKVPVDVALPVLVGAGILISANLYYFSQNNPENKPHKDFMLDDPTEEAAKKNASKVPETPEETPVVFSCDDTTDKSKVVATLKAKDKGLPILAFTITTPELPDLTKEDIVNGKIRDPWLRRIESADLQFKPQDGVSILRADGSAMAYIEYRDTQTRLIGSVFATAVQSDDKKSYEVAIHIKSAGTEDAKDNTIAIEKVADGFQFSYAGKHTLKIQDTKKIAD